MSFNQGTSAFISAIIYDKGGNPLCYQCNSKLIDAELDMKRLDLGLHKYYCPHCDNKLCPTCKHAIVYSTTLKGFACLNKDCSKYYFKNNEVIDG